MAHLENVTITNMCLIYDNDKILVQDRCKPTWPGITFPGGHVEINESFVESTIREIKEETGLEISNLQLCGLTQWTPFMGGRYITIMYKTNCFKGELKSSSEGKVFWINKKDLDKYPLAEDLKEMFTVMDDPFLSEYFCLKDNNENTIIKKLI